MLYSGNHEPSAHDIAGMAADGDASAACGRRVRQAVVRPGPASHRHAIPARACGLVRGRRCARPPRRACRPFGIRPARHTFGNCGNCGRCSSRRKRRHARCAALLVQRLFGILRRRRRPALRPAVGAQRRRLRIGRQRSCRLSHRLHSRRSPASSPAVSPPDRSCACALLEQPGAAYPAVVPLRTRRSTPRM